MAVLASEHSLRKRKKQCEIGIVRLLIIDECCVGSQITSCPSVCIHPRQAACPPQEVGQNCLPLSQEGSWRTGPLSSLRAMSREDWIQSLVC